MEIIAEKYEVLRELGEGASGKVYLVRHRDLGLQYALKVLDKSLSDQRFLERFKREAEVLSRFTHPGSVHLRDFGRTESGAYYMAMDFCEGTTLKKIIDTTGEMPIRRALTIMEQLLQTLAAAHKLGIVHRDIKPENIMLLKDEEGKEIVKVLDFGIAKLRANDTNTSMTMEGASIGTPQYMSPEQASGEQDLDQRVDIYSAGIVLYEMVTGKPPFTGQTVLQTLILHLTQKPAPFAEEFGFPEMIETLTLKALEKNKEHRYQSAEEFLEAIRRVHSTLTRTLVDKSLAETVREEHGGDTLDVSQTKILCLDDSEMILHIMKHILESSGYTVFTANNASAVHEYLFKEGVSLLVTDVQMPDLPGTKVCKMLKKSLPELKVVLFSNLPERELEEMSLQSNADGWISKNTKPKEWLEKINQVLRPLEAGAS